jgi:hypothetical protein
LNSLKDSRLSTKVESKLDDSLGLQDEVKSIKLESSVLKFFEESKKYNNAVNVFLEAIKGSTKSAESLKEFPELKEMAEFSKAFKGCILKHAFMDHKVLNEKLKKVIKKDISWK